MDHEQIFDFVRAWWQSASLAEVCQKTGLDRRAASNLAAQLRRRDVPMKSHLAGSRGFRGFKHYDIAELRQFGRRLADVHAAELVRAKASEFGGRAS